MHTQDLSQWRPSHDFHAGQLHAERKSKLVLILTICTIVLEVGAG